MKAYGAYEMFRVNGIEKPPLATVTYEGSMAVKTSGADDVRPVERTLFAASTKLTPLNVMSGGFTH